MIEIRNITRAFLRQHLPFLDRDWVQDTFAPIFATFVNDVVQQHTSTTTNTALRLTALRASEMAAEALRHLPDGAKRCRCDALNSGEYAQQPFCHVCLLNRIKAEADAALRTK